MWMTIVRIVAKTVLGELFNKLLQNAGSTIFKALTDKKSNRKAYQFVKELNERTDLSKREKMEIFNLKMLDWAKETGIELKDSTLNCLREFAVNVLKAEMEKKISK